MKYGRLMLMMMHQTKKKHAYFWCDCGEITVKNLSIAKQGKVKSCGCYRRENTGNLNRKHSFTGTSTYRTWKKMRGRCLTVTDRCYKYDGAIGIKICAQWDDYTVFLKDMGEKPIQNGVLTRIDPNSDYTPENCVWKDKKSMPRVKSHHMTKSEKLTYCSLVRMNCRCRDLENDNYGAIGITVCDRWKSFGNFFSDMGRRPSKGFTIHRIANDKGYFPENCVWQNAKTQAQYRHSTRWIEYKGWTFCLTDWATILGVSSSCLSNRLKLVTMEEVFTKPKKNGVSLKQILQRPVPCYTIYPETIAP